MSSRTSSSTHSAWKLLPYGQAAGLLPEVAPAPQSQETCPLAEAVGRVLASPLVLDRDEPPVSRSAMDGWAVRSEDGTAPRSIRGVVFAGTEEFPPVGPGEAVAVMTGGTVPEGADAVVPIEQASAEENLLALDVAPTLGKHIRRAGEMGSAGRVLLPVGHRLRSTDVVAAAGSGADPLAVFPRPQVAILATGDEVIPWTEQPSDSQVRDSNRLAAVLQSHSAGAEVISQTHIPDDPAAIAVQVDSALEQADLLVTLGGVSVGRRDHLPQVFAEAGVECLFHGVAMQPGKPLWAGRRGSTFVLGMPGNPVSSFVAFELFAVPLLRALAGEHSPGARTMELGIAAEAVQSGSRDLFLLASLVEGEDSSCPRLRPRPAMGSGDWTAFAGAEALLHLPASTSVAVGEPLSFLRLG